MSRVGKLPKILETIPCGSEQEALKVLNDRKGPNVKVHYIRHHRFSFTVVVVEVAHGVQ